MTDEPQTPEQRPDGRSDAEDERSGRRSALPRVAWSAAVPAVLAVIGAVLPWFAPTGSGQLAVRIPRAYCWQAGRIGFLAPVVLVGVAVVVLGPRLGWFAKDQPPRRLTRDGILLAAAGIVAAGVLALAWALLPASYTFPGGLSWQSLEQAGFDMQRGPQPGFVLSLVAAASAIVCGAVLVLEGRHEPGDG
jgi:hypothetical protein